MPLSLLIQILLNSGERIESLISENVPVGEKQDARLPSTTPQPAGCTARLFMVLIVNFIHSV